MGLLSMPLTCRSWRAGLNAFAVSVHRGQHRRVATRRGDDEYALERADGVALCRPETVNFKYLYERCMKGNKAWY